MYQNLSIFNSKLYLNYIIILIRIKLIKILDLYWKDLLTFITLALQFLQLKSKNIFRYKIERYTFNYRLHIRIFINKKTRKIMYII